jgi:hypothetical protein
MVVTVINHIFTDTHFSISDDIHCPVKLYKVYAEQRPESTKTPESRFYLCANPKFGKSCPSGNRWFLDIPIGKNSLGSIAKRMSEQANFSARHTNHSGRKTSITNLLDAGCPPTEVAQLSGHKNLMSLNSYHSVSINKQQSMSTIIHKHGAASSKESSVASNDIEMDDQSDEELMVASREIEEALKSINNYEEIYKNSSVINLPLVQSPGGHIKLSDPAYLFKGCTFHGNVTINMK